MSAPGTTPGPWQAVDVRAAKKLVYYRIDAGETRVGFAGTYVVDRKGGKNKVVEDAEALANARLIAAAPALYDALEKAKVLIGARNDTLSEAARQSNINEAWHVMDAALAAARSETGK